MLTWLNTYMMASKEIVGRCLRSSNCTHAKKQMPPMLCAYQGLQVTSSANTDYTFITSITAQQRTSRSRNCCSIRNPEISCPHSRQFRGSKDSS